MAVRLISTFAVLILLTLTESHFVAAFFNKEIHVAIFNNLGGNRTLDLHCKANGRGSDMGDLYEQKVPEYGNFAWLFRRTLGDRYPLYYCDMSWERSAGQRVVATGVVIYEFHRDDPLCGRQCVRTAWPNGIFGRDEEHQKDVKIYEWAA